MRRISGRNSEKVFKIGFVLIFEVGPTQFGFFSRRWPIFLLFGDVIFFSIGTTHLQ